MMTLSKKSKNPLELDLHRSAFQGINRMIIRSNYRKVLNDQKPLVSHSGILTLSHLRLQKQVTY